MPNKMPNPSGGSSGTSQHRGSMPAPQGGDFNDFLKPKHLGKSGKGKITLTGIIRDANKDSFSDIFIECKCNGKLYDLGTRYASGNYRRLHDRFGSNPKKWKGTVNVCVKENMGQDYVAIVD